VVIRDPWRVNKHGRRLTRRCCDRASDLGVCCRCMSAPAVSLQCVRRLFAAWWVRLWVFFVTIPRRTYATMQQHERPAIGMMMPASDQIEPRRAQIGARLAWGLCVVSLTLVVLGLVYGAWTHSLLAALALGAPNAVWAVSFPVVGALIATTDPATRSSGCSVRSASSRACSSPQRHMATTPCGSHPARYRGGRWRTGLRGSGRPVLGCWSPSCPCCSPTAGCRRPGGGRWPGCRRSRSC
jgi:hypothetical protein